MRTAGLIRYHASSEARRREELGQFLILTTTDVRQASDVPTRDDPARSGAGIKTDRPVAEMTNEQQTVLLALQLGGTKMVRRRPGRRAALGKLWPAAQPRTRPSNSRSTPLAGKSATSIIRRVGSAVS